MWEFDTVSGLASKYRYTNPGDTSVDKVSLAGTNLHLKNEHENPTGSFKDRSLAFQIGQYIAAGKDHFVVSSSGNAALAAAEVCKQAGVKLDVFISPKANQDKRKKLLAYTEDSDTLVLHETAKAKSDAIAFADQNGLINLRGSKDDTAMPGFATIADELLAYNSRIDAIFIPCSSATSSVAIGRRFAELGKNVAIHICQNTRVHPIASIFDDEFTHTEESLADCVVDRVAARRSEITPLIYESEGFGWVLSDQDLKDAKTAIAEVTDFAYTYNSLLSVAGYLKSLAHDYSYKYPVAVMSGF